MMIKSDKKCLKMFMLDAVLGFWARSFVQNAKKCKQAEGVMAGIEFSIKVDNIKEILATKEAAVERILEAVGLHLEGEAKEELENDPRRIDTGRLRNSITHVVDMSEPAVYVGTNVEYAPYVHFGTVKMQKNEFIKNAFERNKDQIEAYIKEGLENA